MFIIFSPSRIVSSEKKTRKTTFKTKKTNKIRRQTITGSKYNFLFFCSFRFAALSLVNFCMYWTNLLINMCKASCSTLCVIVVTRAHPLLRIAHWLAAFPAAPLKTHRSISATFTFRYFVCFVSICSIIILFFLLAFTMTIRHNDLRTAHSRLR